MTEPGRNSTQVSAYGSPPHDLHRPTHAAGRARDPNARPSSCASKIGGWQANPEHTTANDRPSNDRPPPTAGRFGIVGARARGTFSATALSASGRRTAILNPSGRPPGRY